MHLKTAFETAGFSCVIAVGLVLTLAPGSCPAASKPKPRINPEQKQEGFRRLFETAFTRWDGNRDGKLDSKELNTVIEDPQIHGNESAIAVVLRRRLQSEEDGESKGLTLAKVLELADDPQIERAITRHAWHIQSICHSLFLPGDPELATFHQGGMGDCYLLAVIGAMVYHHPEAIRAMIQPQTNGGFEVHFADDRVISVDLITDAELIMGAAEGRDHGIWLSVLEKAYSRINAQAKEAKTGQELEPGEVVYADLVGHGGYYGPVMVRLTGHKTAGPPLGRWLKEDPQAAVEKMHELLTNLAREHRLMATATRKDKTLPKGIPHGHILAVLDYAPAARRVRMFNPWGNQLKPAGAPGLVNGYPTQHGIFEVPLADFVQIFAGFAYETDKPARH